MAELKFRRGEAGGQSGLIAEQRIFETADGRVVGEDDPDAQSLIAGAGGVIDPRTAERLGLSEKGQEKRAAKEGEPVPSTVVEEPPAEVVRPLTLTPTPPSEKPAEEEPEEAEAEQDEEGEEGGDAAPEKKKAK